ncbi:MAG: endolytic transglycosylase MltG [Actinomyces sp.]|nr:MAG: endolytic transglycosylase MltG [Actinomyces sp.]
MDRQIDPAGEPGELVEFTIPDGATTNDVASDLAAAGVVSNATVFRYWLRCDGDISIVGFLSCDTEHTFKAGDYELRENMSFEEAVAVLDAGPIPEVVFTVTVPEGLRWTEMVDRLVAENPRFERDELEAAFTDPSLTSEFLPPDVPFGSMEGLLFPATYDIPEDQLGDEQRFLQRMAAEFDRRFSALLDDPGAAPVIEELGLRPYDVVIVASLVEEEAKIDADRPRIARVIYNRLLAGEKLGIDATACYAANKPCSELTAADLENPSPWNTRAVPGLPPTPIAAPGEASLRAALQPAEGDWFWYVLTDEGGVPGAHTFASTESEFTAAVAVCREKGYCG